MFKVPESICDCRLDRLDYHYILFLYSCNSGRMRAIIPSMGAIDSFIISVIIYKKLGC